MTHDHDHGHCVAEALAQAEALCRSRGVRLTPQRRLVLELVWRGHRPRGAYDILDELARLSGTRPAPLTVYRALEFLQENGLVHRIESLNAFIGCADPRSGHHAQFFVCDACGDTVELNDRSVDDALCASAAASGFAIDRAIVEIHGHCRSCRTGKP